MTFLEAALDILKRERKPLHYKDITERAMGKKLLTFVGRTPEVTMQTQLTAVVKKAPGNPFVRVKPGVFGLLRYPEGAVEPEPEVQAPKEEKAAPVARTDEADGGAEGRARRRRRGGRGGRGREGAREPERRPGAPVKAAADSGVDTTEGGEGPEELDIASLSPAARAAALAETGVLESNDEDDADEDGDGVENASPARPPKDLAAASAQDDLLDDGPDDGADDGLEDEPIQGAGPAGTPGLAGGAPGLEEGGIGRRRRRRRRRHTGDRPPGGGESGLESRGPDPEAGASGATPMEGDAGPQGASAEAGAQSEGGGGAAADGNGGDAGRRITSPVDAAIEILRGQAPGRGVHVRQLADAAVRRRLIHGEPNEAWRVLRAALAAEPRERLRAGQRPRIRPAGSGLFALTRRPPDMDLEKAEYVFGEARRALRERTIAALEQRLAELSPGAFEAAARVLLQREGFGPATFVKRVDGTVYIEALRGRGARPSRCLIGLRPGPTPAGRRAIGELRAGIRARGQDEGVLILAGRLAEDAIAEWKQPGSPLEVADGAALAETCVRHGVGVINATVSVDFVDADFFAELSEG